MKKPLGHMKLRKKGLYLPFAAQVGIVRRNDDGSPRCHQGLDLEAEVGTEVYAIAKGYVLEVNNDRDGPLGLHILLLHQAEEIPGYKGDVMGNQWVYSVYAHLEKSDVKTGHRVKEGQRIAWTGVSGKWSSNAYPHLHFEMRSVPHPGTGLQGRIDPMDFFGDQIIEQQENGLLRPAMRSAPPRL